MSTTREKLIDLLTTSPQSGMSPYDYRTDESLRILHERGPNEIADVILSAFPALAGSDHE
jgi:hypothetical protein